MALVSRKRTLNRPKTLAMLDNLASYVNSAGHSLYLPPHPDNAEKSLQEISVPAETATELAGVIAKSLTGGAVFWSTDSRYLVLPPFPITGKTVAQGFFTEELKNLLEKDYLIGILLVRLGAYAVGVCRGEAIVSSKVDTGNIHGRHRQGGSSAHRFERHRDKQIEYFFTRVCQHVREHLEPHAKSLDYLVYGGARTTIRELLKQCSFLERLSTPLLPPLLDIPEPRRAVLETALGRIWASTVYEWREEG